MGQELPRNSLPGRVFRGKNRRLFPAGINALTPRTCAISTTIAKQKANLTLPNHTV